MKYATYSDFKTNIGLYVGIGQEPAHYEYDEDWWGEWVFISDTDKNRSVGVHAKSLKELFQNNVIWTDETGKLL